MLKSLRLIRNVGNFDSYQEASDTSFAKLTLIYAENGRGKTTIGAILRSLATGETKWIEGRRRLGSQHTPHVVIEGGDPSRTFVYQNGGWSTGHQSLLIFDDQFVDDNVYSGLAIASGHRQNLHGVILGKQGVLLARKVDELAETIKDLTKQLRESGGAIDSHTRHDVDLETYCGLPLIDNLDVKINQQARKRDALKQADSVRSHRFFSTVLLPSFDVSNIESVLGKRLADLDVDAVARVHKQIQVLGEDGEIWVSQGTRLLDSTDLEREADCPYCGQSLDGIALVEAYRSYFGDAYRGHLASIDAELDSCELKFGGDTLSEVQRAISQQEKLHYFWAPLAALPELIYDDRKLAEVWVEARDKVIEALKLKRSSPLEPFSLSDVAKQKLADYAVVRLEVVKEFDGLVLFNDEIGAVKATVAGGELAIEEQELHRLKATSNRHSADGIAKVQGYLEIKRAKADAEHEKQSAWDELDEYRRQVFPSYSAEINRVLKLFGATFSVGDVKPQDQGGKPSASYQLKMLEKSIPLQAKADHEPGFNNTLSAGDRNTLALAFFFASIANIPSLSQTVIVIDDPVCSFDDGRAMTTCQEVRRLADRTKQMILLSHEKSFLCRLHKHARPESTAALELKREGETMTRLTAWQPEEDQFTQYDHNHKSLRDFVAGSEPDIRRVAKNLRPVLEGYLRVAYPEFCPPGTLLGHFWNRMQSQIEAGSAIMDTGRMIDLDQIREYANRFHHDTNEAWEDEMPSDCELLNYVRRVLEFISH